MGSFWPDEYPRRYRQRLHRSPYSVLDEQLREKRWLHPLIISIPRIPPSLVPVTVNPPFTDADNALGQLGATGEEWTRPHSNLWADAFRRLIRNRLALIGLIIVIGFVLMAILAPILAPYGQSEVVDVRLARMGPSWNWPMGLDKNGRDIFSRLMWGSRVSLVGWSGLLRCHLVDCASVRLDRRVLRRDHRHGAHAHRRRDLHDPAGVAGDVVRQCLWAEFEEHHSGDRFDRLDDRGTT